MMHLLNPLCSVVYATVLEMRHLLNPLWSVVDVTITSNQMKLNKHYIFVISMFFSKHPHRLEFMDNIREEMPMKRQKKEDQKCQFPEQIATR